MGLGALAALGAAFDGYSKDEDAKAKIASDLQLLYLKAEQDRLAKKQDQEFTASQNLLDREARRELKEQRSQRKHVPPEKKINDQSHRRSVLLKTSETVPVEEGCLMVGKWQYIPCLELDPGDNI